VPTGYLHPFGTPDLAISPDGQTLVYGTDGRLFVRAIDEFVSKPLPGTEEAHGLFFSPDGKWIGFTQGGALRKLSIDGGAALEIATVGVNYSGSWSENDDIVYAPIGNTGLMRVSAKGGTPDQVTAIDLDALENTHLWPQVLPGGRQVMYTAIGPSGGWNDARIMVTDLEAGERTIVLEKATSARSMGWRRLLRCFRQRHAGLRKRLDLVLDVVARSRSVRSLRAS
jgi:serine/threonine-protein kinase